MLAAAFAGLELVLRANRHAVEQRYRFFSYGDAMLIDRTGLIDRAGLIDRTGLIDRAGLIDRTGLIDRAGPNGAR
jgi:hypothetical protein